jgi:ferredoxin-thioredoxin reductase catalytic subunit
MEMTMTRKIDVIASGYEWVCPKCRCMNYEIAYEKTVTCPCSTEEYDTFEPEHCYG